MWEDEKDECTLGQICMRLTQYLAFNAFVGRLTMRRILVM